MLHRILKILISLILKPFYSLRVKGLENLPKKGAVILVANHCSYLDPLCLGLAVPRKINWMVLKPYYDLWWLRWFFKASLCFPVNIDKPNIEAVRHALWVLKQGRMLGVFPEGSRSEDGRLKKGEFGAALLALKSAAPILPVAIEGAFEAYPPGAILPKPHPVNVSFGKCFTINSFDHISKENLRIATKQIMENIKRLITKQKNN